MKGQLSKDNIQMLSDHMYQWSPYHMNREMKIKTTMSYCYKFIEEKKFQDIDNTKCWCRCGEIRNNSLLV